ncbi:LacI family DNA-binding transcriptional regulator [Sunxiuqinia elliptica]|uniref:LacI family transcriptional regulator n=1 Tax=Sunxiuqinia elliptica TaxID=655355 RepID=A0A4R6HAS7_9BACT|nr:LacI family DNA-binding transcriptional regulator [Sunxiuqinia elliptica]TDO05470.1 LacI family transcriptional regulator [Sunxiuqinia elliptica]TDO65016.1 LacI family transcriptional regulator [Sunxiuqinia elliptica]
MRKISIQDIAEELKLSKATVSLVLNGRGDEKRIRKETQEKIKNYAKLHNYHPNQFARGLSRGKSEMVGLIIPNISDNFYARIASRIEQKARLSGYTVVYSSSGENPDREKELIQTMLDRQIDGLIIASTQKNQEEIKRLKKMNFPFVLIDRHYPEIETNFVIVDNAGGVVSAVDQLVKQGRTRIGYVSLQSDLEAIHQRTEGYLQAMKKHGLPVESSFIQEVSPESYEVEMSQAIAHLVEAEPKVDGIVFATHYLTAAGLRSLKKRGLSVPADVAVVSYDQMNAFDLIEPPMTCVIQPVDEIGDRAVNILLDTMRENETNKQLVLKTDFVVRKSCGG